MAGRKKASRKGNARKTKARGNRVSRNGTRLAALADKYDLYQRSVQSPENEVAFFTRAFKSNFGRTPLELREDFCAAAAVCCQWAKSRRDRRAVGVDLDPEPLAWGARNNLAKLPESARKRVCLLEADARKVGRPKADIVSAQNFSFYIFKTRHELLGYFRAAHRNLARQGLLILDVLGGYEVMEEDHEEITDHGKFDYVWDQARFDPITHDCLFHIHFRFRDGSEIKKAFTYDWRLWTLPEVKELLAEAGFRRVDVYWEGTNERTGEGNDVYRVARHAASDPAWVAYVVGVK